MHNNIPHGIPIRSVPSLSACLSFLLMFWLGPNTVSAQDDDTQLRMVNTTTLEYHIDNDNGRTDDDNYAIGINRLNLLGSSGSVTTSLRADGVYFVSEDQQERAFRNDLRLERLTVNYSLDDWTVTGGDLHRQLGRGILLSVRKVAEVGRDVSIQGGQVEYSGDIHQVYGFAGRANTINLDNVSQKFIENRDDILTGAQYEFTGFDAFSLGFMATYLQPEERLVPGDRDWTRGGGIYMDVSDLADWLALYVEADVQERALAGDGERGFAGYAAADLLFGDTTFLLEGLYLDKFDVLGSTDSATNSRFVYNQPPTLERVDQEVLNTRAVQGGRLKAEHYFENLGLSMFVNGMLRFTDRGETSEVQQVHGYGGISLDYQNGDSRLLLSGGHRDETDTGGTSLKTMNHAEADLSQSLGGGYVLHFISENEFRTLLDDDFRRGSTFLGLEVSGLGSLTFEYGFDTQNTNEATNFFAGIVALEVSEEIGVKATAGTQRGGIKCVAGVCREFPGFAGTRAEIVGRF